MQVLKDVAAARSIMEMADLGRFDLALTAYGCAYLDNNHVQYYISSKALMIHNYIRSQQLKGIPPTPIYCLNRYVPDYAGTTDSKERQLKYDLAQNLRQDFSLADMQAVFALSTQPNNDSAGTLMEAWRDELIGWFSADHLQLFRETLQETYIAKKLSPLHYQTLYHWVNNQLKQVEDEILLPGEGKKPFWGFVALGSTGELYEYAADANYLSIMQRKNDLAAQGYIVSPLWQKTLLLPKGHAPFTLRLPFIDKLKELMDEPYISFLHALRQLPSAIPTTLYQQTLSKLPSSAAQKYLTSYGYLWGVE